MKKILFIICLLIAYCTSFGQVYYDSTKILDPVYGAGFQYNNIRIKGALWLGDTTRLAVKDSNSLAIHNHKPYLWNGYNWIELTTGTSTCFDGLKAGTGAVAKVNDTTFTVADATFYLDCTDYQTQDTTIRIVAPGDTNRIDGIFGNKNTGLVDYVKGTESLSATLPNYDPDVQFPYAFILTGPDGVSVGTYIDSNWVKINGVSTSITGKVAIGTTMNPASGLAFIVKGKVYMSTDAGDWAQIGATRLWANGDITNLSLPSGSAANDSMVVWNPANGKIGKRPIPTGGSFALTDGNGTTASGTAVNLGGTVTSHINIDDDVPGTHDIKFGYTGNALRTFDVGAQGAAFSCSTFSVQGDDFTFNPSNSFKIVNGVTSSVSSSDSVMMINPSTGLVSWKDASSFGGGSGVSPSDLTDSLDILRDSITNLTNQLNTVRDSAQAALDAIHGAPSVTFNPDHFEQINDTISFSKIINCGIDSLRIAIGGADTVLLGNGQFTVYSGNEPYFQAVGGDTYIGQQTARYLHINESAVRYLAANGDEYFNLDPTSTNSFTVSLTRTGSLGRRLLLDPPNRLYQIGDVDNVNSQPLLTLNGNDGKIVFSAVNGIETDDPGSGVAQWRLGTVISDTVTLDTTQYVEVNINGTIVKLAIVN